MKRRNRKGFTLIELLLVLVILAILTGIVVSRFAGRTQQAQDTAAKTAISNLSTSIRTFEIDTGRYPTTEEGLGALLVAPGGVAGWHGPYIEGGLPKDPWGNAFEYKQPGTHNPTGFDLYSMGADGREGTDDVGNWEATSK